MSIILIIVIDLELHNEIISLRNQLAVVTKRVNDQEKVDKQIHDLCQANIQLFNENEKLKLDEQLVETKLIEHITNKRDSEELVFLRSENASYFQARRADEDKIKDLNKSLGDKDLEINRLKQASIEQLDSQANSYKRKIEHLIKEKKDYQGKKLKFMQLKQYSQIAFKNDAPNF